MQTIGDVMELDPQTNGSSHMDAWTAGHIEGRGRLHRGRDPEVFSPCVEITAVDSRVTDALLAHYGGSVRLEALRNNPNKKLYIWSLSGADAIELLERCVIYMHSGARRRATAIIEEAREHLWPF